MRHLGTTSPLMGVVPIDLVSARNALAEAGNTTTALLHSVTDVPVPGLQWTVRETAAHVVVALSAFTASARGETLDLGHVSAGQIDERMAKVNAQALATVPETEPGQLADRIDHEVSLFLEATADRSGTDSLPTPWYGEETMLALDSATCVLLGEQVVHGYDVARALHTPWSVDAGTARLVVAGVIAMMPLYVNTANAAGLRASCEVAVRGGPRLQIRVDDGTARIAASSSDRVDCHVQADPAAFVLLTYGRKNQWRLIARGKILAWGRKPWMALKFKGLFLDP